MIQAIGEPTVLAVRGFEEHYRMPGGHLRKRVADRVAIPTHHDGKRHRRLAKLERGAEVFAAWCLILGVAARCPKPGVLVDEQGEALSAEDLADMTGFPAPLFELGIEALLDERIGWLVRVPLSSALLREEDHASNLGDGVESPGPDALSARRAGEGDIPWINVNKESDRQTVGISPGVSNGPSAIETDAAGMGAAGKDPIGMDAARQNASANNDATDSQRRAATEPESPPLAKDASDDLDQPDDRGDAQNANTPDTPTAKRKNRMPPIPNFGVVEPMPDAETLRIDDIEEALFHLSLLGRVSPDLYKSKNVTRHVIFDLWLQIDADKRILDTREAFVEQFKKLVLGGQEPCERAERGS